MKKTYTILDKILASKSLEIQKEKHNLSLEKLKKLARKTEIRNFRKVLSKQDSICIIAEIKKASPLKGILRKDFRLKKIARDYENSGLVDAISVVTDKKYFQGKLSFIQDIKKITTLPILRKDFIVDEYQVYESFIAGADALLLLAAAVSQEKLRELITLTNSLGMDSLVEVGSEEEIKVAVQAGVKIMGINARDLKTFKIDKTLFGKLAKLIPDGIITIAESGVENQKDIENLIEAKASAVLIGTSLMHATNVQEKLKELLKGGELYANTI